MFAHTAYFALERYNYTWVPDTTNNPTLAFQPISKIDIKPACLQPVVLTQSSSLSLPLGMLVANVCPQALSMSLNISDLYYNGAVTVSLVSPQAATIALGNYLSRQISNMYPYQNSAAQVIINAHLLAY